MMAGRGRDRYLLTEVIPQKRDTMMKHAFHALAASAVLLLSACVSQPKPLQGTYTDITPEAAMQAGRIGTAVRWGGRIVKVEPRADSTCFEMISSRIGANGRPATSGDETSGRFIACRAGFYDPAVFEQNREVTFTGRIDGHENRRIGEYDYRFPKIAADVVYLWPVRSSTSVVYPSVLHYNLYYDFYPGWWW